MLKSPITCLFNTNPNSKFTNNTSLLPPAFSDTQSNKKSIDFHIALLLEHGWDDPVFEYSRGKKMSSPKKEKKSMDRFWGQSSLVFSRYRG